MYVSNLNFNVDNDQLKNLFEPFGQVNSAKVIMDRTTGRSRGFGFVEMNNDAEADLAIKSLHQKEIGGRAISVSEARAK